MADFSASVDLGDVVPEALSNENLAKNGASGSRNFRKSDKK